MILFPNAKINIGLDILRKRPDGYHDIATVMVPTEWRDVLELVPARDGETRLSITGRTVNCPVDKNLVMKAFRLMEIEFGIPPTDIFLHKVIPDGAGLGGGSADAAFTLTGLNSLYELGLTTEQLCRLGAQIGADCPFFIHNRPMLCTGTGTQMRPVEININAYTLVIVKPRRGVSTAEAYAGVAPHEPIVAIEERITLPVNQWLGNIANDFEPSVCAKVPEIALIKQRLIDKGAVYAAMSGSGSAVFGLFDGDILADVLQQEFAECDIFVQPRHRGCNCLNVMPS